MCQTRPEDGLDVDGVRAHRRRVARRRPVARAVVQDGVDAPRGVRDRPHAVHRRAEGHGVAHVHRVRRPHVEAVPELRERRRLGRVKAAGRTRVPVGGGAELEALRAGDAAREALAVPLAVPRRPRARSAAELSPQLPMVRKKQSVEGQRVHARAVERWAGQREVAVLRRVDRPGWRNPVRFADWKE